MRPTLVVQGFQSAFVDITSPAFSVSASMRRNTCEEILKFARSNGWSIIHAYLDTDATAEGAAALDGFSPWPGEAYVRQKSLSPFRCAGLEAKLADLRKGPIYLISLAGVGVIGATFFDALDRGVPLQLVSNAIADSGRTRLGERKSLAALDSIAGAYSRSARWPELLQCSGERLPAADPHPPRLAASQYEPMNLRAQDLTALILLAQYLLDQAPALVAAPVTISRLLEDVIAELEVGLERAAPAPVDADTHFAQHPRRSRN